MGALRRSAIALFLAAAAALSIAGCAGREAPPTSSTPPGRSAPVESAAPAGPSESPKAARGAPAESASPGRTPPQVTETSIENPADGTAEDLTGVRTGFGSTYENPELGLTLNFPAGWADGYTPVVAVQEENGIFFVRVDFCYRNDPNASMACVTAYSHADYEALAAEAKANDWPILANELGKNGRYVFLGEGASGCAYADGPNVAPFNRLHFAGAALIDMAVVSEPAG